MHLFHPKPYPDRFGPVEGEGPGEHGGKRRCQSAVRDVEKHSWERSDIWVVAPFLCCPPEYLQRT